MKIKVVLVLFLILAVSGCFLNAVSAKDINENDFLDDYFIVIHYSEPYTSDEYVMQTSHGDVDALALPWTIDASFSVDVKAVYKAYLSDEKDYSLKDFKKDLRDSSKHDIYVSMDNFKDGSEPLMNFFNTVSQSNVEDNSIEESWYLNDDGSVLTLTVSGNCLDIGSNVKQKYSSFKNVTSDDVTLNLNKLDGGSSMLDLDFKNLKVESSPM